MIDLELTRWLGDSILVSRPEKKESNYPHEKTPILEYPQNHSSIADTSRVAYSWLNTTGRNAERQRQYFEVLSRYPEGLTDREAGDLLKLPASSISGRRNDIINSWKKNIDEGGFGHLLVVIGKRKNKGENSAEAKIWAIRRYDDGGSNTY